MSAQDNERYFTEAAAGQGCKIRVLVFGRALRFNVRASLLPQKTDRPPPADSSQVSSCTGHEWAAPLEGVGGVPAGTWPWLSPGGRPVASCHPELPL